MYILIAIVWTLVATCQSFVSCQLPPDPGEPFQLHLNRNWVALPSYPKGTVITRVEAEGNGNRPVTFSLDTAGPPSPFEIDSETGVVTVNDTLTDKENRSYSLWVTAYNGRIPQRMEVFATITDKKGNTRGVPRPPQFDLLGQSFIPPFNFPFPPKPKQPAMVNPSTTLKVETNEDYEDTAVTESTSTVPLNPPRTPEDVPMKIAVNNNSQNAEDKSNNVTNEGVPTPAGPNEITLTVVALVVVSGVVFIVVVVSVFMWRKKNPRKPSKKDSMSKDSSGIVLQDAAGVQHWERQRVNSNRYECWDNSHLQLSDETTTTTTKEEPRDEWEFPRHKLRIFNIVGEGAFGQVWRAQATDIDGKKGELTVAVKTLKENASEKEKMDLIQELLVMKNLGTHPNVVRLIGCCTEKEPTLVIMEFVSLGKLQQFLRDSRAERHYGNTHGGSLYLTSRDLTHFAYQVARGMEFLSSKGIIHRDLAARNVLITEERTCKVADFGFARDVAATHVYERKSDGRLPIRWMAPESLYDDIFSVKSDIWSFGVLLWEIVTLGSTPYPGLSAGDVMRKVREGHRLEKPEHCRRELYNIMYYCWEADPTARPDFPECVALLERLLCTETDYIELERFPDHSYYNVQYLDGEKL